MTQSGHSYLVFSILGGTCNVCYTTTDHICQHGSDALQMARQGYNPNLICNDTSFICQFCGPIGECKSIKCVLQKRAKITENLTS